MLRHGAPGPSGRVELSWASGHHHEVASACTEEAKRAEPMEQPLVVSPSRQAKMPGAASNAAEDSMQSFQLRAGLG